uniref:Uncharacterized protein n=1 Tax=Hucho hucho TaxID=62062 RepID=A0A4W5LEC8_9TELE
MFLVERSRKKKLEQPRYEMRSQDRTFQSIVTVTKNYRSTLRQRNMQNRLAAIVCLRVLGLPEGQTGEEYSGLVGKRKREKKRIEKPDEEDTTVESGARKRHLSKNPKEQQLRKATAHQLFQMVYSTRQAQSDTALCKMTNALQPQ